MVRAKGKRSQGTKAQGGETPSPSNDRDTIINRLTELVERQSQQIQQLIQLRDMGAQPKGEVDQPQLQAKQIELVGERFQKLNPPTFEDAPDPIVAEDWLRTLENMFQYSGVLEEEKATCASFMLRGSAGHWWDTMKSIENVANMTWDRFKELFRNKYFTTPIRAMKMNEFIQLRQGTMTVWDYIRKFEQLSRFAAHMVSTEALKVERFLEGLRPELYRDVSMTGIQEATFSQIAEKALVAEQAELRIAHAQEAQRQFKQRQELGWTASEKKRLFQTQGQRYRFQPYPGQQPRDQNKRQRTDQRKKPTTQSTCPKCRKQHSGPCLAGTRACFACGQVGHIVSMCPNNPNLKMQEGVPARVFTMTREDAEANPSVVTGEHSDE